MSSTARGVRAQAKVAMRDAILAAARRQLAEVGPAALSVRAVAREVGMASSAIYRHVASRDELLTMLITDAYDDLGAAIETAAASAGSADGAARFRAAAGAARRWARAEPHRYALVYGSPVPGYVAPQATIGPATRVSSVFAGILVAAWRGGQRDGGRVPDHESSVLVREAHETYLPGVPLDVAVMGVAAWVELFGLISFELFGHLVGSVADNDAFFSAGVEEMCGRLGLT